MTSRERLLKALNGEKTDKVPVTAFIAEQGHFMSQLNSEVDSFDFELLQKNVIDFQRSLGLDVHARMFYIIPHAPLWGGHYILNINEQNDNWIISDSIENNGDSKYHHYTITTPKGILTQTFACNESRKGIFMYSCIKSPLNNEEDVKIAMEFEPALSAQTIQLMKEQVTKIKAYLGDDGIVSAWSNGGLFNNIAGVFDQSELYSLFLVEPEYYDLLMQFAKKRVFSYTQALIDSGVDAIAIGGNSAGGFIGNHCFHDYILPYEKEYIDFVQNQGVPIIYHNCGQAKELLPSYLDLGAKNIEPWSPAPLGDRDFKILQENVGNLFSVTTGLDQVNVLQKGSLEDVERETILCMQEGKKLNSFIMQNVDFLEFGTPLENVKKYAEIALKMREYD